MLRQATFFFMAVAILAIAHSVRATDYWVECSEFRMRFSPTAQLNRIEDATSTPGSGNPIVTTTSQMVLDGVGPGETWDYPIDTAVSTSGPTTTVKYIFELDAAPPYDPIKWLTVDITDRGSYLEFEVDTNDYGGDLHMMRLFGMFKDDLPFNRIQAHEAVQLVYDGTPGNRWYGGVVPISLETQVLGSQYIDPNPAYNYDFLLVHSLETLPVANPPYNRNQHWAFFVCREDDILSRLNEIEEDFSRPPLTAIKQNPANDLDYLFLVNDVDGDDHVVPSSGDVIDFCRDTGIYSVLLVRNAWCDWTSQEEYDHVWENGDPYSPGDMATWIADLKAEGIRVGLHVLYHHQFHDEPTPANSGYYYQNYPSELTCTAIPPCSDYGDSPSGVCLYEDSDLPELIGANFALRLQELGADWVYVDGAGPLNWEEEDPVGEDPCDAVLTGSPPCGVFHFEDEFYRQDRIWDGMFAQLETDEYPLITFQTGAINQVHYDSRRGQVDFWDVQPGTGKTLLELVDDAVEFAEFSRIAGVTPDLGWFRFIPRSQTQDPAPYATMCEWEYMARASLDHNIPIGIQATWSEIDNEPAKAEIKQLLHETTRQRRRLGDFNNNGWVTLSDRSSISFFLDNPTSNTRIDFNLDGYLDQIDLDFFDALYPGIVFADYPIGSTLPVLCMGRCCYEESEEVICKTWTEYECTNSYSGVWAGPDTECDTGYCCVEGDCVELDACACEHEGGVWYGSDEGACSLNCE